MLVQRYPVMDCCRESISAAVTALIDCFQSGHKLLVCGNGGSAADSLHIVGELMKGFILPRKMPEEEQAQLRACSSNADYLIENLQGALSAVSLVHETALTTAFANDKAADLDFAQQVYGYGCAGDALFAISTSGNSKNVLYAIDVARLKGMKVISLTGAAGGRMKTCSDILIPVPEAETYKVQELHLPVYHTICLALENEFFG